MAWATVYFYNKNKFPVTITGDDNKKYYLKPRGFTFVKNQLKAGFTLPSGVAVHSCPGWFQQHHWPFNKPWGSNPGV